MPSNEKPRILIVDDVPSNIKALVAVLRNAYTLIIATSGINALETLTTKSVDMILLDVMMPDMGGYELCKRLKSNPKTQEIPVIFVTAMGNATEETRGFALGAVDYITKPINPAVVEARVKTHLGLIRARKILEKQNLELREAAQLRDEVNRIMRHDLKSPLNAIIGFSDILSKELTMNPDQEEMCQLIIESGYNLLNRINLSHDMFKMEGGTYTCDQKPVDLIPLIQKVCATTQVKHRRKNLTFQIIVQGQRLQPSHPFFILGETLLCFSILNNLIQNAVEASPTNATIALSLTNPSDTIGMVEIHNTGSVPNSIRTTFFDKYVTYGKIHGTGLGTYSAKLMVEAQNGTIQMKTSDEKGTTVMIEFQKE